MVFFGAFEQRGFAVTVVGQNHLQVVPDAQVEAAKDGPRAIPHLHPLLLADLHGDRKQRFLTAPPLTRCKSESKFIQLVEADFVLNSTSHIRYTPVVPTTGSSALPPAFLLLWNFLYLYLRWHATM